MTKLQRHAIDASKHYQAAADALAKAVYELEETPYFEEAVDITKKTIGDIFCTAYALKSVADKLD